MSPSAQLGHLWSLSPQGPVALLVSAAAIALGAVVYWRSLRRAINAKAFVAVLSKLTAAGELERARKLCTAVPDAPIAKLALIGLAAHANKNSPMGSPQSEMQAALPELLIEARAGMLPALFVSTLALCACGWLLRVQMASLKGGRLPDYLVLLCEIGALDLFVGVVMLRAWLRAASDLATIARADL